MGSPPGYEPRRREGGRPVAAFGVVLLTLVLTALLGGCAVVLTLTWAFSGNTSSPWGSGEHVPPVVIVVAVLAGLCLVGGLVWAFRVGTDRSEWKPAGGLLGEPPRTQPLRTWRVAERGVNLVDSPGSSAVVACLGRRAKVVELARRGDYLQVVTADGHAGWVRGCEVSRGRRRGS